MRKRIGRNRSAVFLVALLLAASLAGCGNQEKPEEQLQWQIPLEAPADPHGTQVDEQALPEWATSQHGSASLVWLQKTTTRTFEMKLSMGEEADLQGWKVKLLGLAKGLRIQSGAFLDDPNVDNAAAFVEISRDGKVAYRGWLYADFPEMFGLDDPEWKLWLKTISVQPASQEGNNTHP
ncbi:MAG TPA: DUF2155 domain-containing protein [Mariprofundaceae bacterium]|nr:DUF2155 domain-containing protein [Mariprofundaceae bacterium]